MSILRTRARDLSVEIKDLPRNNKAKDFDLLFQDRFASLCFGEGHVLAKEIEDPVGTVYPKPADAIPVYVDMLPARILEVHRVGKGSAW